MRGLLTFILNLLWLALSGFWLAFAYIIFGLLACLLIITIPFGIASFRLAGYVIWPFGRQVVSEPESSLGVVANIVWFVFCGFWLALAHLITAFALAVTIIGLPMAWANLKLIPLTCFPFGKRVVPAGQYMPCQGSFGAPTQRPSYGGVPMSQPRPNGPHIPYFSY